MESILDTVKSSLGVELDFSGYDESIILGINNALFSLNQLGVGIEEGYKILGNTETWGNFLGSVIDLEAAKGYVCLKTKLFFDPPTTSFLIGAIEKQIEEFAWRLSVQVYVPPLPEEPVEE